ncbi:NAD(P)/FAD-dependent oxidoreductase [Flavihumibacter fluvii]|uniref:NAD(P)/FAD-dependent oxidoreductase n=1 Tax=Flavihumibacter fluvii TaxID=2838157 RepID=UPI001BDE7DB0|nr:FAD-dependent oxidoreductase [Flavihumibacter fluvii]ULQ51881.1 FAD-binding oxidoreductase [Flavihumibacter fluvii]
MNTYPSLHSSHQTDILVMGAGITGALVAWHLSQAGFKVSIVDKAHSGMASTAASTALLQYEIDTPLVDLEKKVGAHHAANSYIACAEAIIALEKICGQFKQKVGFKRRPSIQYASFKTHVDPLYQEYQLRKKIGFDVQFLTPEKIQKLLGFTAPAAIYSGLGAELDAYQLTHFLLDSCLHNGAQVFNNTEITGIKHQKDSVSLQTANQLTITCRHLVIACGYASQTYIDQKIETLESTYAMVSEPMPGTKFWHKRALIWETAHPYLYMRTTADNRILIGGLDDDFYSPEKRDRQINKKSAKLLDRFSILFPRITFRPDFKWAGTFASTKDGLPYIGSIRQRPNTSFALGFGGNGITFSLLAGEIIRDRLKGRKNKNAQLFGFNR